jgi:hypothetical protein
MELEKDNCSKRYERVLYDYFEEIQESDCGMRIAKTINSK